MSKRSLLTVIGAVTLIIALGLVIFVRQEAAAPGSSPAQNGRQQVTGSEQKEQQKAQAIQQAKTYQPQDACTQALTPATHTATGARYTFPSGCLAPGWMAD